VKFWETSAVVCLIFGEAATETISKLYNADTDVAVWWATPIEFASAAARKQRTGEVTPSQAERALSKLGALERSWSAVAPSLDVRSSAERLLKAHPLRAADALQLAAALMATEGQPATLDFVCLDQRLAAAARSEGFTVLP
jgi:predicted nucleic acid-binding protein